MRRALDRLWRVLICVHLRSSAVSFLLCVSVSLRFKACPRAALRADPGAGNAVAMNRAGSSVISPAAQSSYVIVGVSHRTGTAALRERLFADEAGQTELLAGLRAAGLDQGLALSTCDRTELHTIAEDPPKAGAAMRDILARQGRVTAADIAAQGYELVDEAALRQL